MWMTRGGFTTGWWRDENKEMGGIKIRRRGQIGLFNRDGVNGTIQPWSGQK